MRSAARRLYTEDGTLILDVQDLITWSIEYYRRELYKTNSNPKQLQSKSDLGPSEQPYGNEATNVDEKPFTQPTKKEIKRLLEDYDRNFKVDARRLFRWPIEVWVSCGEAFTDPKLISKSEMQRASHREQTERAETELDKQKHALRQMAGRRVSNQRQGDLKPEVVFQEQIKESEVHKLKSYVDTIKSGSTSSTKRSEKFASSSFGSHHVTVNIDSSFLVFKAL